MDKEKLQHVTYSGLLHDIGKLIQRAGGSSGNHSVLGRQYLESCQNESFKKEAILHGVSYHHEDEIKNLSHNDIAFIIYEADNIAAGTYIRKEENLEDKSSKYLCLHSVFNKLEPRGGIFGYKLKSMQENQQNYPCDLNKEALNATWAEYRKKLLGNLAPL